MSNTNGGPKRQIPGGSTGAEDIRILRAVEGEGETQKSEDFEVQPGRGDQ
jgi:hypothetical protein